MVFFTHISSISLSSKKILKASGVLNLFRPAILKYILLILFVPKYQKINKIRANILHQWPKVFSRPWIFLTNRVYGVKSAIKGVSNKTHSGVDLIYVCDQHSVANIATRRYWVIGQRMGNHAISICFQSSSKVAEGCGHLLLRSPTDHVPDVIYRVRSGERADHRSSGMWCC